MGLIWVRLLAGQTLVPVVTVMGISVTEVLVDLINLLSSAGRPADS
jgi:hypothetical protein